MVNYLLWYIGISYLLCLIIIIFIIKNFLIYKDKYSYDEKSIKIMLSLYLAFSPISLLMTIFIVIKEWLKEKFIGGV